MKKVLSILLIISCVIVLGACKAYKPMDNVTPTPAPSEQEQGTPDNGTSGNEATPNEGTVTFEPGIDLEEDILDDEPSVTATPTPKPGTQTPSSGQATPTPDAVISEQPTETTTTATAEPTAQPTEPPVISLPMDVF